MRRVITTSIFLFLVSGIFYVGNLAVYDAAVTAFTMTDRLPLLILGICLGLFSASFIIATIIGSWFYNRFTRAYYLF